MKFFFVGSLSGTQAHRYIKRRLLSYWGASLNDAQRCTDDTELFLDSGAYSARTQNAQIDIEKYAEFIHETAGTWDHIASLDHIPRDSEHPAFAAEKSLRNLRRLEEMGCRDLIPVYHLGEPRRYLELCVAEYPYIGLGKGVARGPDALRSALDWAWSNCLTDADGRPRVKVHGFGMSEHWLATRYPWYSLDSRSWLIESRKALIVRAFINGRPMRVRLRSAALPEEVEARFGVTTEEARDDYEARLRINAAFYRELEHHVPDRLERVPLCMVRRSPKPYTTLHGARAHMVRPS
jgi:hypothetical protein